MTSKGLERNKVDCKHLASKDGKEKKLSCQHKYTVTAFKKSSGRRVVMF